MTKVSGEVVKRPSLTELAAPFAELATSLQELEFPAEQTAELLSDYLASDQGQALERKVDGVAYFLKSLQAKARSRRDDAAELEEGARALENVEKRLKDHIHQWMGLEGVQKLPGASMSLNIEKNGGKRALVKDEYAETPERFAKFTEMGEHLVEMKRYLDEGKLFSAEYLLRALILTEQEADEDAIRAALENGEVVEGWTLQERGSHLRIR